MEGGAPPGGSGSLAQADRGQSGAVRASKIGKTLIVSGSLTSERAVKIAALRRESVLEGSSLRLIAERPNGAVEPLIWLYSYASRFKQPGLFLEVPRPTSMFLISKKMYCK